MRIGVDISQLAYPRTGVANYLKSWLANLLEIDNKNEYVLFFSSLRGKAPQFLNEFEKPNVKIKKFKFPPTALNFMWNTVHIRPIENFVGDVDIFITSDWTEPPARKAKKATIIYDMIIFKYPNETDKKIIKTQKRKLDWAKKESDLIFTISQSSKRDIEEILKIDSSKIKVIYPSI